MAVQASSRYEELQESGGGLQPTFSCWVLQLVSHPPSNPAQPGAASHPLNTLDLLTATKHRSAKKKKKTHPKTKKPTKNPPWFQGTVERELSALLDGGQSPQHLAVWSPVTRPSLFIEPLPPAKLRASPGFWPRTDPSLHPPGMLEESGRQKSSEPESGRTARTEAARTKRTLCP